MSQAFTLRIRTDGAESIVFAEDDEISVPIGVGATPAIALIEARGSLMLTLGELDNVLAEMALALRPAVR